MLNVLEAVPKAKLYYYLSIFHNHSIVSLTLFFIFIILGLYISTFLPNIPNVWKYVSILIAISVIFAGIAITDDTNSPSGPKVTTCVHIKDNLHKIHIEKSQEHNAHNKLMKNHIKALIINQEYYDDIHIKDIKPPLIQHKFF